MIKAATFFSNEIEGRFKNIYPYLDFDEISANLAMLINYGTDEINNDSKFLYGISIWIVDSLVMSENREERINQLNFYLAK